MLVLVGVFATDQLPRLLTLSTAAGNVACSMTPKRHKTVQQSCRSLLACANKQQTGEFRTGRASVGVERT